MPAERARSTAELDAAPTATRTGIEARIAFCTISNPARPLTASIRFASGTSPRSRLQPITLSTALWRPTSSRRHEQLALDVEQTGAVQPAALVEQRLMLAQARRQALDQRVVDRERRDRGQRHLEVLEPLLAAHPARRGGAERRAAAPRALGPPSERARRRASTMAAPRQPCSPRLASARAGPRVAQLDEIGAIVDDAFGVEEPGGELEVVARRAHGDDDRRAVDADLERRLDRDHVALDRSAVPTHLDGAQTRPDGGGDRRRRP